VGLIGWMNEARLREQWRSVWIVRPYLLAQVAPYVLSVAAEQALKPGDSFRECAKDCPEMIVIPAGAFTMGSPDTEVGRYNTEQPRHRVVIARPFAVSKFAVTFDDWDACARFGDCEDPALGRGRQPVINVTWDDAVRYVAWLSRITGKSYRLLTEAEWEYAARAGTEAAYPWGDAIGTGNANCTACGSRWDSRLPAPVGSFAANLFGLYDMHGNVWQWVEDCFHDDYQGAPDDGSAWVAADCRRRVIRGGSWRNIPRALRSAYRGWLTIVSRNNSVGFRVGRTLTP
jgi:formylglycine-generating enzyme required for sulfatase activity